MIITSIEISGKETSYITDFKKITHVYSDKNTQGKTTLIRFIIYGLGYNVPITDKINPKKYKTRLGLEFGHNKYTIIRDNNLITIIHDSESKTISLYVDNTSVLEYLFNNDNCNVLKNILGAHYIDQECGWGLFNRGYVIGNLRMNIDQILYGLSDINEEIFITLENLDEQIKKYKKIISIFERQNDLNSYVEQNKPIENSIKSLEEELIDLRLERKKHVAIINSAKEGKKRNKSIWEYVDSLRIYVKEEGHKPILVNHNNIYGLPIATDILDARIYEEEKIIATIDSYISKIDTQIKNHYSLKNIDALLKEGGAAPSYKIDLEQTKINLSLLKKQKQQIDMYVEKKITDGEYFGKINSHLDYFATKLDVTDVLPEDKILSKEYKNKSGTKKQKLVLAYRLSILKIISEYYGIRLPIIIDSLNRETDDSNIRCILNVLKQEFKDHQLIISTIHDIGDCDKKIKIQYPLLKSLDKLKNVKKFEH